MALTSDRLWFDCYHIQYAKKKQKNAFIVTPMTTGVTMKGQVFSQQRSMILTVSECLNQLFGNPLHRLGRDLGPKVTVKRRRGTSLSKELSSITLLLQNMLCTLLHLLWILTIT